MDRKTIVNKVAEKLGYSKEVVDRIYMHQFSMVKEKMKSPECNQILIPGLASFKFRIIKGYKKYEKYTKKIEEMEALLQNPQETKEPYLIDKLEHYKELVNILEEKVSYVDDRYGFIRLRDDNERLINHLERNLFPNVEALRKKRYGDDFDSKDLVQSQKSLES